MGRIITGLGWLILVAGAGLVIIGHTFVALNEGIGAMLKMMSPFNVWNYAATIAAIGPGLLLINWGKKLTRKRRLLNQSK